MATRIACTEHRSAERGAVRATEFMALGSLSSTMDRFMHSNKHEVLFVT